jgi:DNA-binding NarL/FixJ family response regulator
MENLTDREKEVLEYICMGYSNREIAEKLIVTVHTIKAHVEHILYKFKVRNRVHLAYVVGLMQSDKLNLPTTINE